MIKLIATDLDGTLFYPKRRIALMTRKNKRFLIDYHKAGGEIVLVTGRSLRISKKVDKKLGFHIPLIGCGGSFIYQNGEFIQSHPIDRETMMDLFITFRRELGIIGWIIFDETDIIKIAPTNMGKLLSLGAVIVNGFLGAYREKYYISESEFIKTISTKNIYKVMPAFGLSEGAKRKAQAARIAMMDKFGDKLTINVTSMMLEITAEEANKADTLKDYIKMKGIKEDEVAVVGDSYNDISMFEAFENSFGMKSGENCIRRRAKHLIDRVSDMREYSLTEEGKLKK